MKKKIFAILFVFITSFLFAQENEKYVEYLRENNGTWSNYEKHNGLKYYDKIYLYDSLYIIVGYDNSDYYEGFVTDGESYCYARSFSFDKSKTHEKNQWQDGKLLITDYNFDIRNDFLYSCETGTFSVLIEIISPYFDCKSILYIELEDYDIEEYQLGWIEYCVINGNRGIRIKCRGKVHEVEYGYVADGGIDQYAFFYWSPKEQKYILDETVTQEQIKNALCPEDYFAYNGLEFSKLDSKLTDADLKDLDKAQLRLMRNAVYARHGRTFKSVDLQSLWECYTWYKKNPNYNDDLLTDIDKYNIELIQKYEAK